MKVLGRLVLLSVALMQRLQAFSLAGGRSWCFGRSKRLFAWSADEAEGQNEAFLHNTKRTDIRIFLTQRAIQSFIFLLIETRDPHTVRWMENRFGFVNLENFHGTGGFNLTLWDSWDAMLRDMMDKPKDVVIVSARRRGRGHGGWSKNNPYLEDRFVEFEIEIDPPSLVSRIMSVREQIAYEWISDLNTILAANENVLESYYENMARARSDEECLSGEDLDTPSDCIEAENHITGNVGGGGRGAFERNSMTMLRNAIAFDERSSSPYRKGSFDLLLLLATQESVHRVLRSYRSVGEAAKVSYAWFRDFYVSRVRKFFDGSQDYGRADDFLEELILTMPSMKTVDNSVQLVDPMRFVEDIIKVRSEVSRDWGRILNSIGQEHMSLRRDLLSRQMGSQRYAEIESTEFTSGEFD